MALTRLKTTLDLLRSQSLTSVVYKAIEQMILNGGLKAGERINENQFAASLAISRGPIREALRALEQAGLVRVVANRGVFVRELSLEEAIDAYDVRATLFGLAGQTLASFITAEQGQILSQLVDRMETAKDRQDLDEYYPLNLQFHGRIVEFAANKELERIYLGLVNKLHLFRRRSLVPAQGLSASHGEHRQILKALLSHDPAAARERMENHVLAGKRRLLRSLQSETTETQVQATRP
jgi:DNA-binding GntR family transcriptional regulator